MSQPRINVTPDVDSNVQVLDDSDYSDFESDEFEYEDVTFQAKIGPSTNASGHRGERVRELVTTELEYVHDLEILVQVTTRDVAKDKYNVLDMKVILGNIAEVIDVARRFSQELKVIAHQKEDDMVVGKVFLQFVEELGHVYKVYCSAYNVDVLPLMKKYEQEETTSAALKQVAEELRCHKRHLLDFHCVLIKPVQRFLKYPLYLDELVHSTPESHVDYRDLQDAKKSFQVAAKDINEYTRGIDLVHKYREVDHSPHGRMLRMNLHSLARRSFRVTRKLSQKLGVPHQIHSLSSELKQLEIKFNGIQKATQILVKNVTSFVEAMRSRHSVELIIAEVLVDIFPESVEPLMVQDTVLESCNKVLQMFDNEVQQRVLHPARQMLILCEGPANVIQKTRNIMVDSDMAQLKLQAALEPSKIASVSYRDVKVVEESAAIRNSFEALCSQLKTELPIFIEHSLAILTLCAQSLVGAHMYLQGHLAKLYLQLAEEPGLSYMTVEDAEVMAKQRTENLLQLLPNAYQKKHTAKKKDPVIKKIEKSEQVEICSKSQERGGEASRGSASAEFFKSLPSISKVRSRRSYPLNSDQTVTQVPKEPGRTSAPYEYFKSWSSSSKIRHCKSLFSLSDNGQDKVEKKPLEKQYPSEVLYKVVEEHKAEGDNELNLSPGAMVAVLKRKDPMGGENRWVVDDGDRIGVVRKECLKLAQDYENERPVPGSDTVHMPMPVIQPVSKFSDSGTNSSKASCTENQILHPTGQTLVPLSGPVSDTYVEHLSTPASHPASRHQPAHAPLHSQDPSHLEENLSDSSDEWYQEDCAEENEYSTIQGTASKNQGAGIANKDCQPHHLQLLQYVVLYNFTAAETSQLSVQKGQVVVGIHTEYPDWWYMKDDYGCQGYVPASYLVKQG